MKKSRLDATLMELGMARDTHEAFIIVTEGRVFVDGQKAVSPGQMVGDDDAIEVRPGREFVGRGAYKLEAAIEKFGIDVQGKICADIGAAAGGFTEILLKHGAVKVYAIDLGRGKLALKLREDPRVVVMEGVNVLMLGSALSGGGAPPLRRARSGQRRNFAQRSARRRRLRSADHAAAPRDGLMDGAPPPFLGEGIDAVTTDLSFTSLRRVLPVVRGWLASNGKVIALFKPQYEIEDKSLLKHGILRDEQARSELVEEFRVWLKENRWQELGFMESPIRGSEGNVEYFFYLRPA